MVMMNCYVIISNELCCIIVLFILKEEVEEEEREEQLVVLNERSSASSVYSHKVYLDWVNEDEEIEFDIINIDPELLRMPFEDFYQYVAVIFFIRAVMS